VEIHEAVALVSCDGRGLLPGQDYEVNFTSYNLAKVTKREAGQGDCGSFAE